MKQGKKWPQVDITEEENISIYESLINLEIRCTSLLRS